MKSHYVPFRSLLCACLCAAGLPGFAQVPFTINGEIKENVCTPILTGSDYSGSTLNLKPVDLDDLDVAGKTAGDSTLTFAFNNCKMSTSKNNMWVFFESGSVDGAGRIIPTTGTGYVRFEIRDVKSDGTMGNLVQVGGTAGDTPTAAQGTHAVFTGSYPSRSVSKSYIIRYYANQTVTLAGVVSANATYTVKYF